MCVEELQDASLCSLMPERLFSRATLILPVLLLQAMLALHLLKAELQNDWSPVWEVRIILASRSIVLWYIQ